MICVDASVAAKWVLPEEHSARALALVTAAARAGEALVAPPLLPFEVTNILRRRIVRRELTPTDAERLLAQFLAFPVTLLAPPGLYQRALAVADAHDLPAAYNAHYLALALELECAFWTDDRRLLRRLGGTLAFVRSIAEHREPSLPRRYCFDDPQPGIGAAEPRTATSYTTHRSASSPYRSPRQTGMPQYRSPSGQTETDPVWDSERGC